MTKEQIEQREYLGRLVRAVWVKWASEQTNAKPSWLAPWSELSDPDKEVDRRIGCMLFNEGLKEAERVVNDMRWSGESDLRSACATIRTASAILP